MNYDEYIERRRAGTIIAGIENADALQLIRLLPRSCRAAHIFWFWVWLLSIPVAIVVGIFWKWWVGLFLLFFVSPLLRRAVKRSAAEFVLEHAEANRPFFEMLVERNILMFRDS